MRKGIFLILFITILGAASIYFLLTYVTEFSSTVMADIVPEKIQKEIGQSTIQYLSINEWHDSRLTEHTQKKIKALYKNLFADIQNDVEILFKSAPYANAMALPGNYIIVLDSLIQMSTDTLNYADIMGVLAHETGHLYYKHSLKLMIKSGMAGILIGYFIGDFSIFVSQITQQLLTLSYSRAYEEQADDYALQLLSKNKISTIPLSKLLEKISKSSNNSVPEFLSTHPYMQDRILKIKQRNIY